MTHKRRFIPLDWFYLLLICMLIGAPFCAWLWGLTLSNPANTTNATPTIPAIDVAACARQPLPHQYPSPNGRFCAVSDFVSVVIVAADGRHTRAQWAKWIRFDGWTADSTYALYSYIDQYGNSAGIAFDIDRWQASFIAPDEGACFNNMSGLCGRGVVAIAPRSPRVLLRDGRIVYLPDRMERDVLCSLDDNMVLIAAWSPDETKLAFVTTAYAGQTAAVYLFEKDTGITLLQSLSRPDLSRDQLIWGTDETSLQLISPTEQYDLLP